MIACSQSKSLWTEVKDRTGLTAIILLYFYIPKNVKYGRKASTRTTARQQSDRESKGRIWLELFCSVTCFAPNI